MKYKIQFLQNEIVTTTREIEIETDVPIHGANKSAYRRSLNQAFAKIPFNQLYNAQQIGVSELNVERTVLSAEEMIL